MDVEELKFKSKSKVPFVDVTVKEDDVESGALNILKVIRSAWAPHQIRFKLLTDGITNKLVACRLEGSEDEDTVLVRVYGNKTDLLIDRTAETRNIILLNSVNLAPDLYASFRNGLAYKFVPGCTLNCDTIIQPKIYKSVAKRMAQLHKLKIKGETEPKPMIWEKIKNFVDLVPDTFTDPDKHRRYKELVLPKTNIEEEIKQLKSEFKNMKIPIVFAHNDLLLGNVIYNEKDESICFIDYEYAAFNYQAFDIGNHFAEFAGLDVVDYTKYPNKDLQLDWLKTYLTEFKDIEPTPKEIKILYVQVNKFVLLAHLFWGVWALIQAEHSHIDFDYISYAAIRFNEYISKKEACLALTLPE